MESRSNPFKNWIILFIYIALFVLFYSLHLDGQIYSLGDDFAQYIQHASNIHQGLPYSNLPYPFNPLSQIGPPAYPPVYPLLISPFTGGAVPQIIWMKAMSVFLFGIALLVLYKIFQAINDTALAPETLLIFPFLPWIFLDAGYLGSDTPYACFSFISLWSLTALPEDRPGWIPPIITGLLIALSTLTRDTGIALWAGSLLYLSQKIWKNQRARSIYLVQILLISTAFLLPLISWKIYEDHLGLSPANMIYLKTALGWDHFTIYGFFIRLVSNFYYYLTKSYELLFPLSFLIPPIPYLNWLRFPITLLILAMIAWQVLKGFRGPLLPIILYMGCYLAIFLVMDFHISRNGSRMLIPLAPFLVFFTLKGFRELSCKNFRFFTPFSFRILIILWIGLNFFGTFYFYSTLRDPKNLSFSPEGASYQAMVNYIRQEIPLSGRIAFIKARYLSLYTHHQTVIPPYVGPPSLVGPPSEVLACLSQWQVSHVLVDDHFIKEEDSLRKTIDQFPGYFSRCYSSPPLTLFQFQVTK